MINSLLSLVFNLCTVYDIGVIDNAQSGSHTTPSNTQTTEFALNSGGITLLIFITILLAIFFVLSIIFFCNYRALKNEKNDNKDNNANIQTTTAEENQILSQYRNLNEQEKKLINDTLTMLNNKSKDD